MVAGSAFGKAWREHRLSCHPGRSASRGEPGPPEAAEPVAVPGLRFAAPGM